MVGVNGVARRFECWLHSSTVIKCCTSLTILHSVTPTTAAAEKDDNSNMKTSNNNNNNKNTTGITNAMTNLTIAADKSATAPAADGINVYDAPIDGKVAAKLSSGELDVIVARIKEVLAAEGDPSAAGHAVLVFAPRKAFGLEDKQRIVRTILGMERKLEHAVDNTLVFTVGERKLVVKLFCAFADEVELVDLTGDDDGDGGDESKKDSGSASESESIDGGDDESSDDDGSKDLLKGSPASAKSDDSDYDDYFAGGFTQELFPSSK